MFRVPTVLVVGAGASFELGLPQGGQLLDELTDLLNITFEYGLRQKTGDTRIQHAVRQLCIENMGNQHDGITLLNEYLHAGRRIREAAQEGMSIDAIIDQHEDDKVELMGKVSIVRAILMAERKSTLGERDGGRGIDVDRCRDSWLPRLGRLLVEGRRKSALGEAFDNLTIVTFNYDRCIEQYLPYSLSGHYGLPLAEARALVGQLPIYHPFGTVGRLPWFPGDGPSVEFGADEDTDLIQASTRIRTFTEQMEDARALAAIRAAMEGAERVVFLGFAYHRQNLDLIQPTGPGHATSIFGTVKGISIHDKAVVQRQLAAAFEQSPLQTINLLDITCTELFDQNWRSLTE